MKNIKSFKQYEAEEVSFFEPPKKGAEKKIEALDEKVKEYKSLSTKIDAITEEYQE